MPNKVSNKCIRTFKIKVQQRIFHSCHSHKRKQCRKIHFRRLSLKKSEPKMSRLDDVIHTLVTIPKEQLVNAQRILRRNYIKYDIIIVY